MQRTILTFVLAICSAAAIVVSSSVAASAEQLRSARIVTSSEDHQITKADHTIGLQRTVNPHKMVVLLPPDAEPDQEFVVDDLAENFSQAQVTVRVPAGHTILKKRMLWVLSSSHTTFRYFGEKIWSVEP